MKGIERMEVTAYRTARDTGERAFGGEHGPTVYAYDVRDSEHYTPPATVSSRSDVRSQGAPPEAFADVPYRVEGRMVSFPGRQLAPAPLRSGTRDLLMFKQNTHTGNCFACFRCDCGRGGRVQISTWRTAAPDTGCSVCRKARRDAALVLVPRHSLLARIEREKQAQQRNPVTVGRMPGTSSDGKIWAVSK